MLVAIFLALLFFYAGFALCKYLSDLPMTGRSAGSCFREIQHDAKVCRCGILSHSTTLLNQNIISVPVNVNENLQKIFDLVFERFISSWFNLLSEDEQFPAELKVHLQHICSAILLRVKSVDLPTVIEHKLLPCAVHHVEHLLAFSKVDAESEYVEDPLSNISFHQDDSLLSRLYYSNYLHPSMLSRESECLYLREVVQRVLPRLVIPPCLKHPNAADVTPKQEEETLRNVRHFSLVDQAYASSHFYHQQPNLPMTPSEKPVLKSLAYTPVNQCAFSFLTEILANHCLLPALDSIANPDSLNTVLLYLLDPPNTDLNYPEEVESVPLLNAFMEAWFRASKKLPKYMELEALLRNPEQLGNFVEYMKFVNCSPPMTVLLLMFEISNAFETAPVSADLCQHVKSPLRQLLVLLHTGRVIGSTEEDLQDSTHEPFLVMMKCSECLAPTSKQAQMLQLLGMPSELADVIRSSLYSSDSLSVARLLHTPEWTRAYASIFRIFETSYLPAYLESSKYIESCFPKPDRSSRRESFKVGEYNFKLGNHPNQPLIRAKGRDILQSSRSFSDFRQSLHSSHTAKDEKILKAVSRSEAVVDRRISDNKDALRPPLTPELPKYSSNTTATVDEDLDFFEWWVSVPAYCRKTSDRSTFPLWPIRDMKGTMPVLMSTASPQSFDFSVLNYTVSRQGYYTVQSGRIDSEKSNSVFQVSRKYADFYVLEQKLIVFHETAITVRLPPKRHLGPRDGAFLETIRPKFETFLQFLIRQPFLRKSELIFAFLTSPVEFASTTLPDINLGKLVKSVPILLSKEKGQYLEEFLENFHESCLLNTRKDRPSSAANHGSPSPDNNSQQYSILEHRLRSRHYWNNARISPNEQRIHSGKTCSLNGSYISSFYELFGYLFDNFRPKNAQLTRSIDHTRSSTLQNCSYDTSIIADFYSWLGGVVKLFFNCLIYVVQNSVGALERAGWIQESSPQPKKSEFPMSSSLPSFLRRAIINIWLRLGPNMQALFDSHMRSYVARGLGILVKNNYLAPMLLHLRDSIFFPSRSRTEKQKAQRRQRVSSLLRKFITRFHLQWFSEDGMLQSRFERVFELFQHPKWNKQLTYILFDHLMFELFPDVFRRPETAPS